MGCRLCWLHWDSCQVWIWRDFIYCYFLPIFLAYAVTMPQAGPVCSVLPRGRAELQMGEFMLLVLNVGHSVVCCGKAQGSTVIAISHTAFNWLEQKSRSSPSQLTLGGSMVTTLEESVLMCRKGVLFRKSPIFFWSFTHNLQRKCISIRQSNKNYSYCCTSHCPLWNLQSDVTGNDAAT